MIFNIAHILVAAVLAVRSVAADFTVDTPNLVQCQTATVNWNGGNANFLLFVVPANDVCADSVVNIPQTGANSLQWNVTLAAGSQVEMVVADADGQEAWSGTMTVQPSNDTSCIDQAAMQALVAAGSGPVNTTSSTAPSSSSSSNSTWSSPSSSGNGAVYSANPAVPSGAVGNAGASPSSSPAGAISGAAPRVSLLPTGSIFAVAAVLFGLAQL